MPDAKRMPYQEVPAFLRALRGSSADESTRAALEWLVLTVTRTTETLGARSSEIDERDATWTIPPARSSSKKTLVVPLAPRALEICRARAGKGDLLFESTPGRPLGSRAMIAQMQRMNTAAVPHGFRYSFRAWQDARGGGPPKSRRTLLDEWAAFCWSKRASR